MDPIAIKWVIEPIEWLIKQFTTRETQRNAEKKAAIEALLNALHETRIYFGTQRANRTSDRETEEKISRLWVDASEKIRPFDKDLAQRCYIKGKYWADPVGWRDEDLLNAGIMIEQVEDALRDLRKRLGS